MRVHRGRLDKVNLPLGNKANFPLGPRKIRGQEHEEDLGGLPKQETIPRGADSAQIVC